MDPRVKLLAVFRDFHGGSVDEDTSDLEMIVDILELLIEKSGEQEDHTHTLT